MIIKLEKGGPGVTLTVATIADDVSQTHGNKAQYKICGRTAAGEDACIWLFADSAERQFKRIGVTRASVIGRSIDIVKNAKGFYDVTLAEEQGALSPAMAAPAAPAARAAAPSQAKQAFSAGPLLPGEDGYVAPAKVAPAAPAAPATADTEGQRERNKRLWTQETRLYEACVDHVLKTTIPKFIAAGVPITQEGTSACIATLYIGCQKRGIIP